MFMVSGGTGAMPMGDEDGNSEENGGKWRQIGSLGSVRLCLPILARGKFSGRAVTGSRRS